ncbi:PKD domain-containing protein [Aquimarina sp. 433]
MKKLLKFITVLIIGLITIISCQNDDVDTDVPSQRVIFTSEQSQANQIRVNTDLTFGDVSTGVVSRTWTFPEGVANVTQSNSDVVKATFTQVGEHNVTLNQVFEEDAFVDGELRGRELDTTIVVTVIEPIAIDLKANYINPDGTLGAALTISDNAENEVIASRAVRYTFDLVGEPLNIDWTIDGGDPETATGTNQVDVIYKRLGTYGINVDANTNRPAGQAIAAFSNLVKVIPSTDPVTLDGVQGKRDGTLALEFSREMDEATVVSDQFSINVENNGTPISATIQSVQVNPAERNILLVSLSGDQIYIDDTVTVSYTAGSLFTTDGVQADSFMDVPMDSFEQGENLLESTTIDYSFENSADDANWPYQFWGGKWELYDFSIDFSRARTGTRSGVVDMQANGGMIIAHTAGKLPIESGKTYEIGVWVFVENVGNTPAGSNNPDLRIYLRPSPDFGTGPNPEFSASFPTGEWVYSSILVTGNASEEKELLIRGDNEFNNMPIKIYMDDLFVSEVELRP